MGGIRACPIPVGALLGRYQGGDGYADCYAIEVPFAVSQAQFVEAFYTTCAFKIERLLLALFASRPCTDAQARELARGERERFAAWSVEERDASQLLLCDFLGRTRSWLMAAALADGAGTRLHFGSAVVARVDARSGKDRMGFGFRALLGFHRLYSRVLLAAAVRKLRRRVSQD